MLQLCQDHIAHDALYGIATVWLCQNGKKFSTAHPRHIHDPNGAVEVPYGMEKQPRHVHGTRKLFATIPGILLGGGAATMP